MNRSILLLAFAVSVVGCIYSDVQAPYAYRSPTPADVGGALGPETKGTACNTAILWLVAFGDGGYEAAVADAKKQSSATLLADVRTDTQYTNIFFGFYQRQCTVVSARAVASATPQNAGAP